MADAPMQPQAAAPAALTTEQQQVALRAQLVVEREQTAALQAQLAQVTAERDAAKRELRRGEDAVIEKLTPRRRGGMYVDEVFPHHSVLEGVDGSRQCFSVDAQLFDPALHVPFDSGVGEAAEEEEEGAVYVPPHEVFRLMRVAAHLREAALREGALTQAQLDDDDGEAKLYEWAYAPGNERHVAAAEETEKASSAGA
jgi:hypothetical protein